MWLGLGILFGIAIGTLLYQLIVDPADSSPIKPKSDEEPLTDLGRTLKNYCLTREPGYALMINADWGTGKTTFIKKFIEKEKQIPSIYISLYGAKSIADIEERIFIAQRPKLSEDNLFAVNHLAKAGLSMVDSPFAKAALAAADPIFASVSVFISRFNYSFSPPEKVDNSKTVLYLDDCERCDIGATELFSYFNFLVEHHKCKVILICNRAEFEKKHEMSIDLEEPNGIATIKSKTKLQHNIEKLQVRCFDLEIEFSAVIERILNDLDESDAKHFMLKNRYYVEDLYKEIKINNYRSLKFASRIFADHFPKIYLQCNDEKVLIGLLLNFIGNKIYEIHGISNRKYSIGGRFPDVRVEDLLKEKVINKVYIESAKDYFWESRVRESFRLCIGEIELRKDIFERSLETVCDFLKDDFCLLHEEMEMMLVCIFWFKKHGLFTEVEMEKKLSEWFDLSSAKTALRYSNEYYGSNTLKLEKIDFDKNHIDFTDEEKSMLLGLIAEYGSLVHKSSAYESKQSPVDILIDIFFRDYQAKYEKITHDLENYSFAEFAIKLYHFDNFFSSNTLENLRLNCDIFTDKKGIAWLRNVVKELEVHIKSSPSDYKKARASNIVKLLNAELEK